MRTFTTLWAVLVLAAACQRGAAPAPGAGSGAGRPDVAPVPVQAHVVGQAPVPREVAVDGVLLAQEELVLGLQVGGRLQELAVDAGDTVATGQLLAALDPRDFDLEADRARAALGAALARLGLQQPDQAATLDVAATAVVREAQAVLRDAALQRQRLAEMVQQQMRPAADLDAAEAALGVAESRVQRAQEEARTWLAEVRQREVEVRLAEKRRADTELRAPWAGRVAARQAVAGQVLPAGAPVLTLLRIEPLRLQLAVPERLAAEVRAGQPVRFTVDGRAGPERRAAVVRVGAEVARDRRTLLVEAAVPNPAGDLLPGAFCRARIEVAAAEPVVVVPKAAVATFAGVARVFPLQPGKAGGTVVGSAIVSLGRDLGDAWEVVQGLAAGDRIAAQAKGLTRDLPVVVQ